MPYTWSISPTAHSERAPDATDVQELKLWPHNSLPPRGAAALILSLFTLAIIPMLGLLGSAVLWGLLPFVLLMVAGTWYALEHNYRQRRILEVLTLSRDNAHLVRTNPNGQTQEWECNQYWARAEMYEKSGPVPFYITLSGGGREVEIGAFLAEDERKALYPELVRKLRR
ncbi:DUF2244 domain-containing protein [Phaeobacter sp. NW0010-22]|uniref:DUF2244 domain-containing protein n=1 Tax=Phaeobacter sp. NW0010-22 TaxID=3135907 RepID=UPI00310BE5DC